MKKTAEDRAREEQQLVNAYHRTFAVEDGQTVLADLERIAGYRAPVFQPVKTGGDVFAYDPITAALVDGARKLVIHIHAQLARPCQGDANAQPKTTVTKP